MRKKFEASLKARVAMEALKGEKTLAQISSEYSVHANLISRWKQELLKGLPEVFNKKNVKHGTVQKEEIEKLYRIIGELKVENDWFKKNSSSWTEETNIDH